MVHQNKADQEKPFTQDLSASTPRVTARSGLLTIPPEVRLQIYDIYFASPSYNGNSGVAKRFEDKTTKSDSSFIRSLIDRLEVKSDEFDSRRETSNLNLLFVSRLIHAEAIPIFYHHHRFFLPTYCSPVPASGWTGIGLHLPTLRQEQMHHFDLIKKMDLAHHHLGDVVADRLHTDRAISSLLNVLVAKCPSLRQLTIRVRCDVRGEFNLFYEQAGANGWFPYLDFRRQTPKALAALMPRLDRLEILLGNSQRYEDPRVDRFQAKTISWAWARVSVVGRKRACLTRIEYGSHFFCDDSTEISPDVMLEELRTDMLYHLASMEPFAHFFHPGFGHEKLDPHCMAHKV